MQTIVRPGGFALVFLLVFSSLSLADSGKVGSEALRTTSLGNLGENSTKIEAVSSEQVSYETGVIRTNDLRVTISNTTHMENFLDVFTGSSYLYAATLFLSTIKASGDTVGYRDIYDEHSIIALTPLTIDSLSDTLAQHGYFTAASIDTSIGIDAEIIAPTHPDTALFIAAKYKIYNLSGSAINDLYIGFLADWDVPYVYNYVVKEVCHYNRLMKCAIQKSSYGPAGVMYFSDEPVYGAKAVDNKIHIWPYYNLLTKDLYRFASEGGIHYEGADTLVSDWSTLLSLKKVDLGVSDTFEVYLTMFIDKIPWWTGDDYGWDKTAEQSYEYLRERIHKDGYQKKAINTSTLQAYLSNTTNLSLMRFLDEDYGYLRNSGLFLICVDGSDTLDYRDVLSLHTLLPAGPVVIDSLSDPRATHAFSSATSADSNLKVDVEVLAPKDPDSSDFVILKYQIENLTFEAIENLYVGFVTDWDVPDAKPDCGLDCGCYVSEYNYFFDRRQDSLKIPATAFLSDAMPRNWITFCSGGEYATLDNRWEEMFGTQGLYRDIQYDYFCVMGNPYGGGSEPKHGLVLYKINLAPHNPFKFSLALTISRTGLDRIQDNVIKARAFVSQQGDVNNDGQVSVSDVIYLINYLFKGGPSPHFLSTGDVTCDGQVTISDVVCIINYLFKNGTFPSCP